MDINVNVCAECGVPELFAQRQTWLNNGEIVQVSELPGSGPRTAAVRLGFVECESLDPLFREIGQILGRPVEGLVMDFVAEATERYAKNMTPEAIIDMIRSKSIDMHDFVRPVLDYCGLIGYGKYQQVDFRYENDEEDYSRVLVEHPFSVPEAAGAIAGVVSALVGGRHGVSYREVRPGVYEFTTHWSSRQAGPDIAEIPEYVHVDGDLELEACPSCGVPRALSGFFWDLEHGFIIHRKTGRRMAILGPESLDALFKALEMQLGERLPATVVEAQRRFVKNGMYSLEEISEEGDFRTQLAVRGMGNLQDLDIGRNGISMRINNAAGHLLTVGMVQGIFEVAFDMASNVEWALSEQRDLQVQISPRA